MTIWIVLAAGLAVAALMCRQFWVKWSAERRAHNTLKRRRELMQKYGPTYIIESILASEVIRGMSEDMAKDALGAPDAREAVDDQHSRWIYEPTPIAPERMFVFFEGGLVSDWELTPPTEIAA